MSEAPSPRQILYGLVAAGFVVIVAVLTVGAASAGLVPQWWSLTMALVIALSGSWMAANWRRTSIVLSASIALFVLWMIGTLLVAG